MLNEVRLIGNLGNDPEVRVGQSGTKVARLSVATNERWTDKDGKRQEHTEWHRVVCFGQSAEFGRSTWAKAAGSTCRGSFARAPGRASRAKPVTPPRSSPNGCSRSTAQATATRAAAMGNAPRNSTNRLRILGVNRRWVLKGGRAALPGGRIRRMMGILKMIFPSRSPELGLVGGNNASQLYNHPVLGIRWK